MNRTINLKSIHTRVVGLASNQARRAHMTQLISRLGLQYEFIDGLQCTPGWVGCALSELKAVMINRDRLPLLVLEDDLDVTDVYSESICVPDDADIVYLGISSCGYVQDLGGVEGTAIVERFNDQFFRVLNMTSTHAILYLTPKAIQFAINTIIECTAVDFIPHDVGYALNLDKITALAPERPFFFQAPDLQPPDKKEFQRRVTDFRLKEPPIFHKTMQFKHGPIILTLKLAHNEDNSWTWNAVQTTKGIGPHS